MVSFKLNIADTKTGKCYKTEVKDAQAAPFMGLNIGEKIEGSKIGLEGFEFELSGGTDYCGFPMRHGILGVRKRITVYKGTGFRGGLKGIKRRKTVCGHKINESIAAINLKVIKEGTKKLSDMFGKKEGEEAKKEKKPKEEDKKEAKPEKKEAKKEVKEEPKKEVQQEKTQQKEPKKESKPEAKPEEKPREQAKEKQQ